MKFILLILACYNVYASDLAKEYFQMSQQEQIIDFEDYIITEFHEVDRFDDEFYRKAKCFLNYLEKKKVINVNRHLVKGDEGVTGGRLPGVSTGGKLPINYYKGTDSGGGKVPMDDITFCD